MESNMTQLYKDLATEEEMTIERAVSFLEREAKPRSFSDIVEKFCEKANVQQLLIEGLKENHPELAAGSVEKRVRGWFQGKHSMKKQDAIELCFILGLSLEQADDFVTLVSEERLHWRNPEEITDIFSLMHGYSYAEATALKREMEDLFSTAESSQAEQSFTSLIKEDVSKLHTKEELAEYLRSAAGRFGRFHNNAYRLFQQRLQLLEKPEPSYFDDEPTELTIRDILRDYMYESNVSYAKERARRTRKGEISEDLGLVLSVLQKSVISSWPDETMLSKMKSRKTDVTRKTLILLLMATEEGFQSGGAGEDAFYDSFEAEDYAPSKEEVFDDVYGRLNQTLLDCGFSGLDPRSPFDWMILYSICVQDMFDADTRMRELFRAMFGESGQGSGN